MGYLNYENISQDLMDNQVLLCRKNSVHLKTVIQM